MAVAGESAMVHLAIAGNPNSGKTTLFNRLTGLRQKVANYAGVTVERKEGYLTHGGREIHLIDLPGTYSLTPFSEEERIAAQVIEGLWPGEDPVDGVLCVMDSTTLEKSLFLALQVIETGVPCAIVLNMMDELHLRRGDIHQALLAKRLGVPVYPVSAVRGEGLEVLRQTIAQWPKRPFRADRAFLRLPTLGDITNHRRRAKEIADEVWRRRPEPHPWSDRIDRVVMHPIAGPIIFGLVVLLVFQSIFTWAAPVMDAISGLFDHLGALGRAAWPASWWSRLLTDGILAGVGSVVVFLPQILIVFFFLAVLEQSGYLARAALVMDRALHAIGLQGKSFLPLISSYACAIPGIMAARTIESKHDRLATIFIAPFMTCSARLPVYALLIGAFVPDRPVLGSLLGLQALTLLGLYALGFAAALVTAWGLKSSVLKSDRAPFFLELPPYRWPHWRTTFLTMWDRAKVFLGRAGTIILLASVILWALASFPSVPGPDGHPDIERSIAGRIGHAIEPLIAPLGFDWRIGIGLLSAQAAREVIVSALATIYHVESADATTSLQQAMQATMTPLAALSLMIFFALALQCTSTLAVARRETGSWRIPIAMFVYMNVLAYVTCLLFYQTGRLLGF